MKPINHDTAALILPDLQEAVAALITSWNAQRQVEALLGADFSNLQDVVSQLAVGADDDAADLTIEAALDALSMLEVDGDHDDNDAERPVPGDLLAPRCRKCGNRNCECRDDNDDKEA